jgi:hypothetical protein
MNFPTNPPLPGESLPPPAASAGPAPATAADPLAADRPRLLWGRDALRAAAGAPTAWLWHGYLAPGSVTLLTGELKSGKTTLAAVLLAKMKAGGELAGRPLRAGRAVVVSEEPIAHWERRSGELGLVDHVGWYCRPFKGKKPRPAEWSAFVEDLAALRPERGVELVVIDSLAAFFPGGGENHAGCMLEALLPLQRLTAAGMAVLPLHHPRKGRSPAGQTSRGSGALTGYVDIIIEMRRGRRGARDDRRRKLQAFSRFPETPRQLAVELNPAGSDYLALGTFEDPAFADTWRGLERVLAEAPHKLTRRELRKHWSGPRVPDDSTLYRWLDRAAAEGLVRVSGLGTRRDPLRYWLPAREAEWRQDPFACLHMPELFASNAECRMQNAE